MNKILTLAIIFTAAVFSYGMSSPNDSSVQNEPQQTSTKHDQVYIKPHAGVELNYNRPKALQAGETFELQLNFKTQVQADSLQVNIKPENGLQLGISQLNYQFTVSKKNQINKIVVPVTALQDGRYFIDIKALLMISGKEQARSFSIPVTVGDPLKSKPVVNPGYNPVPSQGVISMPASETTD